MYLATKRIQSKLTFILRRSIQDKEGNWISEDIMDLGADPEEFVDYIDERVFLISPMVEDALHAKGVDYQYEELEEIFWPFIDPDIKQRIDDFGGLRGREHKRKRRFSPEELSKMQSGIHWFDKRRMLFLKFLQVNTDSLMSRPLPFLNQLLNKSRDELEHNFEFMEMDLRPWEMRGYLYSIFRLPERFAPRLSRFIPDVQDQELMDSYFLEEICLLNSDEAYLDKGARPGQFQGLHPYLRRYLIQYFDFSFRGPGPGRRAHETGAWRPPATQSDQLYLRAMGLSKEEFDGMSEREFISFYRKRAQELHPDKGGDHDAFIRLKEAFEILIIKKKW